VRRKADVVFTRAKVAVYVHGCFWHRCPVHATRPKANAEWWAEKLARNVERDADTRRLLQNAGWTVIEVWEHEEPARAAAKIRGVVLGVD
jgi:DNA mismatch endonuclease (patch repair protein)